eukprot:1180664-Prorocentrum_minimum.AAC.3
MEGPAVSLKGSPTLRESPPAAKSTRREASSPRREATFDERARPPLLQNPNPKTQNFCLLFPFLQSAFCFLVRLAPPNRQEPDPNFRGAFRPISVRCARRGKDGEGKGKGRGAGAHVSPVTAALCASEPFPPKAPVSTYFFALSQAPPALLRKSAIRMPLT